MVEARRQEDWQHTAWLAAMIANANRDPKKKPSPFTPDDFNPLACRERSRTVRRERRSGAVTVTKENIGDMRAMFDGLGRSPKCEVSDGS